MYLSEDLLALNILNVVVFYEESCLLLVCHANKYGNHGRKFCVMDQIFIDLCYNEQRE